ncbi:hypothetical protein KY339_05200, partial [Candidatus Woesearchaeota archaeon]|nr:hypothetical protein [Candidatus Woesearchaeota archaeon]
MGVTKKPGGKERKKPSGSSRSIQSRTELERKLEKLLRDYEWVGEELRVAVNKISPLLELSPSKQALGLIEHSIKEKQLMPPSKSASIDLLVYELSDIEKRRHQNPRFSRHASWVYREMNKWKADSKDFLGDVIESVADLARLHSVPRQVIELISDFNTKLVENPHINRYFNHIRKAARDFSEFRRKPHPLVYKFIKRFAEKDPLCTYSDKYKYFTHIPRSAPKELLFIISRGLTSIEGDASESPEAMTLLKVVEETSKIYERYTEPEIEEFFSDFDFSEEEDPMDVVRRLHDDLVIKRMAKSDVVSIVDKSIENIEKEENVRLYTRDRLKEIETKISPQEASKFSDTLKVFEDLGVGPRMIDITRLLANHMLGRSNQLEDRVLAAMIQEASKAVNDARQEKREIDTMAKGPGPKKCSRAMRNAFLKEHGIDVKYYWDLRPFQLRLYKERRAALSYLALTETELDK